jgi:hypothetical protein
MFIDQSRFGSNDVIQEVSRVICTILSLECLGPCTIVIALPLGSGESRPATFRVKLLLLYNATANDVKPSQALVDMDLDQTETLVK